MTNWYEYVAALGSKSLARITLPVSEAPKTGHCIIRTCDFHSGKIYFAALLFGNVSLLPASPLPGYSSDVYQNGSIHRDIKPDNMKLDAEGARPNTYAAGSARCEATALGPDFASGR